MHRRPNSKAPDRTIEVQDPLPLLHIGLLKDLLAAFIQLKGVTLISSSSGLDIDRGIEGDPPDQYAQKGGGVDPNTAGVNGYVHSACVPETGILTNKLMIRRMNKDLEINSGSVFFHLEGHNLSHLDLPVVNGRANIE